MPPLGAGLVGCVAGLLLALGPGRWDPPPTARADAPAHDVRFAIALYYLRRPTCDPKKTLERLVAKKNDLVVLASAPRGAPARPAVLLGSPRIADYAPPGEESLTYFGRGLSAEQRRALPSAQAVSVLAFFSPAKVALSTYRAALALSGSLAEECDGLLWDDEARLAFSPATWRERSKGWSADGVPDVDKQISVHMYRDGELIRMITLGMAKLGLPDVVVNQVPSSYESMESVITLLCQRLVEGAQPVAGRDFPLAIADVRHPGVRERLQEATTKNARGRSVVHLAVARRDEGDPDNVLLEIVFPGRASDVQQRQAALMDELFGSEDRVVAVKDNAALLAASARARRAALRLKPRYAKAPPLNEMLEVKAPFKTSTGGTEWMWVEVVRWEGSTIHGVLRNDPFEVPGLKSGARVDVEESSIFDYILTKPDGQKEGNETGPLLEASP